MLSFLVLASRTGRRLSPDELSRVADRAARSLPFVPASHVSWTSVTGLVAVLAWDLHPDGYPPGPRWYADEQGITAFGGIVHEAGRGWRPTSWARQVGDLFRTGVIGPGTDACRGVFAAVSLAASGSGFVTADPLSVAAIHRAATDAMTVIANRPDLAAAAIGNLAQRDAAGVGWLLVNDYVLDDHTSFVGVRSLTAGLALAVDGSTGRVTDVRVDGALWDETPAYEDAVRVLTVDLLDRISTIADLDRPVHLSLSGGRDSRLVLAMAMAAGVEHSFCYMTAESYPGEDDVDPDVLLASRIAERFGLEHRIQRLDNRGLSSDEFEQRVRVHAGTTSAMLGAKGLRSGLRVAAHTQISGAFGDVLTGPRTGDAAPATVDDAETFLVGRMFGGRTAGLVRPDVKQHYVDAHRRILESLADDGSPPDEIPYRFYLRHIVHNWLPHELYLRGIAPNIEPLYSTHIPVAARASGWLGRRSHRLHFDLMCAAAPALAAMPFALYGWPEQLLATVADADRYHVPPVLAPDAPRGLRGLRWEDHVDVFRRYLLDDVGGPMDDLLDRPVVEDVLAGRRPMPRDGVKQLHNALGVAVWLGRHEASGHRVTPADVDRIETSRRNTVRPVRQRRATA